MGNISAVVYALAIPFACGVAVQRLVAVLDAFETWKSANTATRAWISAGISFAFGLLVVLLADMRILNAIATANNGSFNAGQCSRCVDVVVSALIISAGTEGFNSIIKFLGYAKEQTKATAADKTKNAKQNDPNALKVLHS